MADFQKAMLSFFEGVRRIREENYNRNFPTLSHPPMELQELQKRWRIVTKGEGVYCFIDKATGDVLKPASYTKPAKHARGNIFDETNGLARMGPYGPAYMR